MIKILIADDSATETALLKYMIEEEPDMQVIGCAKNGQEAIDMAEKLRPDLITMDIQMPLINGFDATRRIMMHHPVPIVVISSALNNQEHDSTFLALEAGALSVLEKPINVNSPHFSLVRKHLINTLRNMAEIKVVTRRFATGKTLPPIVLPYKKEAYQVIAIGASVGGPEVLKKILTSLPEHFPLPIVIVQHMTSGFLSSFCKWLNESAALTIKCVEEGELLEGGKAYFAPDNQHFIVQKKEKGLVAHLQKGPAVSGFCPSISVLFHSIAKACGKNAVGLLLTGMGSDGAEGLLDLKQKKAHTLIQNEASSVVFGMGRVAESLGAVDKIISADEIGDYLKKLVF